MTISLSEHVYNHTDRNFPAFRLYESLKAIYLHKGCKTASLTAFGLSVSTVVSIALSYFCVEGSIRSFMIVNDQELSTLERLRPLGDVGGWMSLSIFSTLALKSIFEFSIREGEYLRLPKLCEDWVLNQKDEENPVNIKILKHDLSDIYRLISKKCYVQKSLASRKLNVLKVFSKDFHEKAIIVKKSDYECSLENIDREMNQQSVVQKSFKQLYYAKRYLSKKDSLTKLSALIFGIAIPILLISNATLSLIGEVGLGSELFGNRSNLEDTGHFGEWPINTIEALSLAWLLHSWYLLSLGNFWNVRKIYQNEIKRNSENQKLQLKLKKVALQELSEIASESHFLILQHEIAKG